MWDPITMTDRRSPGRPHNRQDITEIYPLESGCDGINLHQVLRSTSLGKMARKGLICKFGGEAHQGMTVLDHETLARFTPGEMFHFASEVILKIGKKIKDVLSK